MADLFPGLQQGAFEGAIVHNFIADEAINVGSPVIYVAAGTNENKPRVEPNDTQGAAAAGVVVGGDADGVYGGSGSAGQMNNVSSWILYFKVAFYLMISLVLWSPELIHIWLSLPVPPDSLE